MRTERALKNIVFSIISYIILLILNLLTRRLFLQTFGEIILGYMSLFDNIFMLLSVTELGASYIFAYRLYAAIANNDEKEISIIMSMYKYTYNMVGVIVLILGLFIFGILPFLFQDEVTDWGIVKAIYLVQLGSVLCNYFLGYRRALLEAEQKSFLAVKVDTIINMILTIVRIIILVRIGNIFIYVTCTIIANLINSIIVWYICKKENPNIGKHAISFQEFRERKIFQEMGQVLKWRLAIVVYNGTDNIIISKLLGIKMVGLYSNYYMVYSYGYALFSKLNSPIQPSIGNLINAETKNKSRLFLRSYEILSGWIGMLCYFALIFFYQVFIGIVFGEKYLLADEIVFLLAFNFYLAVKGSPVFYFRNSMGNYEVDSNYMLAAAITNISVSLLLGWKAGLSGVVIGTIIGQFISILGRTKIVISNYYDESMISYFKNWIVEIMILLLGTGIVKNFLVLRGLNLIQSISMFCVFFLGTSVVMYLLFHKDDGYVEMVKYIKSICSMFIKKIIGERRK